MPRLSIHLFGSFRVLLDDAPVTSFESSKVRALLAYLACEAKHPHSRDELIGLLWPEQDDRSARRNLSQALFNLRQAIGDGPETRFLEISRETIQLNPESDFWLDVCAFEKHLAACPLGPSSLLADAESHIPALEQAEALYQGEFLSGFFVGDNVPFSEWITLQREQYHCLALEIQQRLAQLYAQRHDYPRASRYTRRQVELEPWREDAHQSLMRLLARSGQRSAALRQYELCRRALLDELGVTPQPATYALYERIRMAGGSPRHNLPDPQTPFIGRRVLLDQVLSQMDKPDCRLLTLLGPGGIGKTRLAWQAAHHLLDFFLNGVWNVPLAGVGSAAALISALADALGLQFSGGRSPKDQLLGYLQSRELLLVLDGFEHLLDLPPADSADPHSLSPLDVLTEILRAAPHVKLLVTSRQRLNLRAEWLVDVPGLSYPPAGQAHHPTDYDAVQLFLQHAHRVQADFELTTDNQTLVASICQMLDGAPLGIELAAPWVRLLSCAEIAAQIQADMDFLVTSLRDVPARHQSLRAVFTHSWNLLDDAERRAAARLSVFRRSFDRQAAEAVTEVAAETALALAQKSIISQDQSGRYIFHALLKQYLTETLAASPEEQQQVQQAHCRYYAAFLHQRQEDLRGKRQKQAQAEIRTEIEEIRAAWDWGIAHQDVDAITTAAEAMFLFYRGIGRYQEGLALFQCAAAAIPAEEANCLRQVRLSIYQADFHGWLGNFAEARALLQQSLAALQAQAHLRDYAFALTVAGQVAYWDGEYSEAQNLLEQSVALHRQAGDAWGTAMALNYLANAVSVAHRNWDEIAPWYAESLALSEQIGDQAGAARALINLGAIEHIQKDFAQARTFYTRAVAYSREVGNRQLLATALGNLGDVVCRGQDYAQAIDLLQESLGIKRELGNRPSIILTMNYLGQAYLYQGEHQEARRWYLQGLELAGQVGSEVYIACMLVSLAGLLVHTHGDVARAAELLQVGLDHAGDDLDIIASVEKYWPILQQHLCTADLAACRQRAHTYRLEDVVAELLAGA